MGKKKGKGKSQPQQAPAAGDQTEAASSSQSQEPEAPKAPQEQKGQRKQKQRKGQEAAGSGQAAEPPKRPQEQQRGQQQQQQRRGVQETPQGLPLQQAPQPQQPLQQAPQPQQPPQAWRTPQQAHGLPPQQLSPGIPQQQMQRGPLQQQPPGYFSPQQLPQQPFWGPPSMPMQQGQQQFGVPVPMQPQQPPTAVWGQQRHQVPPQMQQQVPPQFQQQVLPQHQQQIPAQLQQQRSPPPGMAQQLPPGFVQPPQQQQQMQGPPQQQQQQQQRQGPPQQQQRQAPPQQQQQRQAPPQQQQQRQGPSQQQQQRQGPSQQQQQGQGPPPQQQQRQGPPQQQQQRQQPQQQRPSPRQPSSPQQAEQVVHSPKDQSPPFGGQGDCLKQLSLVKPGTKGRKISVEANHLALNVGKLLQAVHYDVNIVPDTPKSLLRDVMNLFGKKYYPNRHPAFDGRKNLYSPTKLPFGDTDAASDTIKVEGENRPKEFKVEVKFARMVDLSPLHDMLRTKTSPQDALQCLDIVLRNAPSNTCITAGRCFFTPPVGQIIQLGDGMEMYYGFYQSAIRGWKPLLNVDVAHKAFPSALEVLDLICELGTYGRNVMTRADLNRPIHDNVIKSFDKFIKTLKVKYEITGQSSSKRIYRVNGLGESAARAQFKLEDGKPTTVEKYFAEVKRYRLKYPHLPTLWVGAKERDSKILLPVEFCSIVEGQTVNRKMNENQTSAMIKKSATSTDIRKQKIMASLEKARYNNDPCIREFGFSVNNQFEKLEARVLQPPNLLYANNSVVSPSKGVWRSDRSRFLVGATIKKWTIACVTRQPCKVDRLAEDIFKMAGPSGMQITQKASPPFVHIGPRQNVQEITEYFRSKEQFDLIFVVVPNSGPQYSYVKQAAELNIGCLTQCIKERTLFKLNPQTVGNILLKVNSKMNGTNHTFNGPSRPPILNRPCMIMGADVTHPSPDAKDIPSVAAVTASHDPKAFKYNICWRLQPPKMEIIEDLCNITIEQLKFFHKETGLKPERIVFFRDGVSEGQFKEVQRAEIRAIQQACMKIQAEGYRPSITFLVVQKRHHTRLFPTNPRDSEDRNMNVPAGTCVDTMITNPTMQDFYLVSHASIQGVAKPTKYCTLWDDNNMTNDDIEELTYHLCHMFTRCNRSVSYPAPTYYAHLAAARAKVYIENDKLNMDELKRHQENYQIKECISKGKPMFFV